MTSNDYGEVPELLQRLESELRRLGWWSPQAPSPEALASTRPFHVDTLAFEEWLQWILLPRLRALMDRGAPLPGASAMAPMGEVAWRHCATEAAPVIELLSRLDQALSSR